MDNGWIKYSFLNERWIEWKQFDGSFSAIFREIVYVWLSHAYSIKANKIHTVYFVCIRMENLSAGSFIAFALSPFVSLPLPLSHSLFLSLYLYPFIYLFIVHCYSIKDERSIFRNGTSTQPHAHKTHMNYIHISAIINPTIKKYGDYIKQSVNRLTVFVYSRLISKQAHTKTEQIRWHISIESKNTTCV